MKQFAFDIGLLFNELRPSGKRVKACTYSFIISKLFFRDGRIWDTFATSVLMSTYLVAFVVSDFASLVDQKNNFTVWARPNAIDQAQYALEIGPRSLEILSDLFDEDYHLEKMDMVAVPDFAAGAMENWGLITYRESRMLYDANESSAWSQQDVASVIVHECAHMWFGNLVTPTWWGYLWLSEGFARYYQYMATAKVIEVGHSVGRELLSRRYLYETKFHKVLRTVLFIVQSSLRK